MTEQEYINVKALGSITSAINILKDIVPGNLEVITTEEYIKVMSILCRTQLKLENNIETII